MLQIIYVFASMLNPDSPKGKLSNYYIFCMLMVLLTQSPKCTRCCTIRFTVVRNGSSSVKTRWWCQGRSFPSGRSQSHLQCKRSCNCYCSAVIIFMHKHCIKMHLISIHNTWLMPYMYVTPRFYERRCSIHNWYCSTCRLQNTAY